MRKLTTEQREASRLRKMQFYIDSLTPEKRERYFNKKSNTERTELQERKRLRALQQAKELRIKREQNTPPKLYGEDNPIKKQQIEKQIEQLLKERESKPLDYQIQYKINQLNCRL
jgi:hypothetical protein